MSLRALDRAYTPPHAGHAIQTLSHQFEDLDQQNECYIVGMWSFLVTEIMFFGALFLAYSVYRVEYFQAYLDAHRFLSIGWGTVNTFVLLFSSYMMAMAVHAAQVGNQRALRSRLLVVIACSIVFLGVKTIEYSAKIHLRLFPGPNFNFAYATRVWDKENPGKTSHDGEGMGSELRTAVNGVDEEASKNEDPASEQPSYQAAAPSYAGTPIGYNTSVASVTGTSLAVATLPKKVLDAETRGHQAQLFFCLYFTMTGLHALHIIIGILMMSILWFLSIRGNGAVDDYMPTELVGFYWHFVDIVWIFLFPMMYLIS